MSELASQQATLDRCRTVAKLLDEAIPIPGTNRSVGADAIIGLLPGAGDLAMALASSYIVVEALRLGASKNVVARMAGNVLLDFVVGSIPILGDLFDAAFKANLKNVTLLEEHLEGASSEMDVDID